MTQYTRDRQGPDGSGVQSGVTTKLGQPVGKLNELSRQRRCSMILQMQHGRLLARLPTSFLEKNAHGTMFLSSSRFRRCWNSQTNFRTSCVYECFVVSLVNCKLQWAFTSQARAIANPKLILELHQTKSSNQILSHNVSHMPIQEQHDRVHTHICQQAS